MCPRVCSTDLDDPSSGQGTGTLRDRLPTCLCQAGRVHGPLRDAVRLQLRRQPLRQRGFRLVDRAGQRLNASKRAPAPDPPDGLLARPEDDRRGHTEGGVDAFSTARAAATTALAYRRPGARVVRSIGPDTDTAATTRPVSNTGALTEATPRSRSSTLSAHPLRRTAGSAPRTLPPEPTARGS